jgi:hypothetical protein
VLEHPLDVGQPALIRNDIDPGDQVVGHAKGEHGDHRAGGSALPGQGIRQGNPLCCCVGHCAEPGGGLLSEIGCWEAGLDPESGVLEPIVVTVWMVCSEAAAEDGLA